jgi:Flagellar hook-associated protein
MSISAAMSVAMAGMRAQAVRAAAIAQNVAHAGAPGHARVAAPAVTQAGGGVVAQPRPAPSWPDRSEIDLAAEILDITETQIAFKASAVMFETGADMWEMLAAAFDGKRR